MPPNPATTPAAMPPEVEAAIIPLVIKSLETHGAAVVMKAVEKALADRPNPPAPVTSDAKDLQLDVPKENRLAARLGVTMKAAYLAAAERQGKLGKDGKGTEHFVKLKAFVDRAKAAGQFLGVFEQGGMFARETMSSEFIEALRPASILLNAGAQTVTDYGTRLTNGYEEDGVRVYWVAEGQPGTESTNKSKLRSLGAHKAMVLARVSNDLMRLSNMDASAIVGRDMIAAFATEVDTVGLKGPGVTKPLGIRTQMKSANRSASAGTSVQNKIDDVDGLMETVHTANIPGGLSEVNKPFYYCQTATMYALRKSRDNAGWVFPDLRDARNPRVNGFPVFVSETLAAASGNEARVLGFGLAALLLLGEAVPLEIATGENGTDFAADMMTMRGITEVDWLLRRPEGFAEKHTLGY